MKLDEKNIIAKRPQKTIYRDGETTIKLFDNHYSKVDVLSEALNQARVEETGLHVPKIIEVCKVDGQWAIISDFIEGKTLAQMIEESSEKIDEYLEYLVDLQLEIFSKKCPKLNKLKDKMNSKISNTKFEATVRYELHTRLESMPKSDKVCHGDFTPGNVIIRADGTPFIIDWTHATQGNAAADVARTYLRFYLGGHPDQAETYLRLYCHKSDTAKQYIQKWLPIVAASQSTKNRPDEQALLAHWVNVVDYE